MTKKRHFNQLFKECKKLVPWSETNLQTGKNMTKSLKGKTKRNNKMFKIVNFMMV